MFTQALNQKSEVHQIFLTTIEGSAEFVEDCRQSERMRPIAEQRLLPTDSSSLSESSSSSSSENSNYFLSHAPKLVKWEFKTSHYTPKYNSKLKGKDLIGNNLASLLDASDVRIHYTTRETVTSTQAMIRSNSVLMIFGELRKPVKEENNGGAERDATSKLFLKKPLRLS